MNDMIKELEGQWLTLHHASELASISDSDIELLEIPEGKQFISVRGTHEKYGSFYGRLVKDRESGAKLSIDYVVDLYATQCKKKAIEAQIGALHMKNIIGR